MNLIGDILSFIFQQDAFVDMRYPVGSWIFSADNSGERSRLEIQIQKLSTEVIIEILTMNDISQGMTIQQKRQKARI